jgi:hypothetical protein
MLSPTSILHFYLVRNTTHSTHTPNLLKTDHIKPSHTIHIPKILLAPCCSALQHAFPSAINNKKSPFFESTQANTTTKKKKKKHLNCSIGHLCQAFAASNKKGLESNPNPKQST